MSGTDIAAGGLVESQDLIASTLTIESKQIDAITDDFTSGDPQSLVTAYALKQAVNQLTALMTAEGVSGIFGVDEKVLITNNLVSEVFALTTQDANLGWTTQGWSNTGSVAAIANTSGTFITNNKLSVPPGRYPAAGYYFYSITVSQLSGTLSVVLNGTSIATISTSGTYEYVFEINNAVTTTLDIIASGVSVGNSTILSDAKLYGINTTLYNFVEYIAQQFTADSVGSTIESEINAALAAHLAAYNPHHITTTMIGAAPTVHYHSQYALISQLSNTTVDIDVITSSVDAYVPSQIYGSDLLRPSTILKTNILSHLSESSYSQESGYITSSVQTVNSIANAVFDQTGQSLTYFNLIVGNLPVVTYTFEKQRVVSGVTVYTQPGSEISGVTEVSVVVGSTTQTLTFTPGSSGPVVTQTVTFSNVTSSNLVISVVSVYDNTQPQVSLGFSVSFSDTGSQALAVSADTKFSVNLNGQIINISPSSDIPITISSASIGHEYLVSLKTTDGINLYQELLPVFPTYGDITLTYQYPFRDFTQDTDPYYGTTSITGVSETSGYYQIYTNDNTLTFNSNVVVVTQSFITPISIDHIDIDIPITLLVGQAKPTPIIVNLTFPDATTDTLTITPTYIANDQISQVYTETIDLSTYGAVIQIAITLTSPVSTICEISQIDVAIASLAYDTTNHIWSDGLTRKIVGSFTKLLNGIVQTTSQPIGKKTVVPINDILPLQFYNEYTIQNPFKSRNVKAIPVNPDGTKTGGVQVISVEDSLITILVLTSNDVYFLEVTRNW